MPESIKVKCKNSLNFEKQKEPCKGWNRSVLYRSDYVGRQYQRNVNKQKT